MKLFEKMDRAMQDKDADAYAECLHDDYEFVRHQSGTTINKEQMFEMMRKMLASEDMKYRDGRCLYENDDILVTHAVMDYPDGTREAVLSFETKKDGKILRTESGATLLPK